MVKTYAGPDAGARKDRERAILTGLAGLLPLPPMHGHDAASLTLGFVAGTPGQELLVPEVDDATAAAVLGACGTVLSRIHAVDAAMAFPVAGPGVLVHGDFGPNNVLVAPEGPHLTAVVDWEFSRVGDPIVDLAWCEWIVRMHHPDRIPLLDAFFDAYGGDVPGFGARRAAMVARCRELLDFCERWEPGGGGVELWQRRLAETTDWTA